MGDGVILEQTTPIGMETFHQWIKGISQNCSIDLQGTRTMPGNELNLPHDIREPLFSFFNLSPIRMPIFIRWHVWYYLSSLYLYLQVSITQVFIWMLKEARDQSGAEWLNTHWLLKGTWCRIRRTLGSGSLFCKRQEALQRSCERSYRQNSAT